MLAICLVSLVSLIFGTTRAQSGIETINIASDVYSSLVYRDLQISIFRSIRNTTSQTYNYRYQPVPLPILNEKCKYNIKVTKFYANYWLVSLPITFNDETLKYLAYLTVKKKDLTVIEDQVRVLDAKGVHFEYGMEFSYGLLPGDAKPRFKYIPTDTMGTYRLDFMVTGEQNAKDFAELLPWLHIEYKIDINGKKVLQNLIIISTEDLKKTNFYLSLNGNSGGKVNYVHREQAKELLMNSKTQMSIFMQLESPSLIDDKVINKLLEMVVTSQKQSLSSFSKASADVIFFNRNDMTPDKIETSLNKDFTRNEDHTKFTLSKSSSGSGGFSLFKFGFKASASSSYTKEEISDILRQHDVQAEFTGEKWIVKDMFLSLVNYDYLNSNSKLTFNSQYVSDQDSEIHGVLPGEDLTNKQNCIVTIPTTTTTTTTTTVAPKDVLIPGEKLRSGQMLLSSDKNFRAIMQDDGNFVVYNTQNNLVWQSKTFGGSAKYLDFTSMGVLNVVNADTGAIVKQLFTNPKSVAIRGLYLLTNGNLVILEATGSLNAIQ